MNDHFYDFDGGGEIKGIGCDLGRISRIASMPDEIKEKLAVRILTDAEYKVYCRAADKNKRLAVYFCAKEAVAKALGTGMHGIFFYDIDIGKDSLGRPRVALSERGKVLADKKGVTRLMLTLSHDGDNVMAVAVAG